MTGLGSSSTRDPQILSGGNPRCTPCPGAGDFGSGRDGAKESSTLRLRHGCNLRRAIRVGTWNVLTLADDSRLPLMSDELGRLGIGIAALSEVRRPGTGTVSVGGYTYYWSGCAGGQRQRGVAVAVSGKLSSSVVKVTPVDERIMAVRLRHSLGFVSLIAVYAPTEVSSLEEKETFYAVLQSVVDSCPPSDTLLVLGDFNACIGADRDGYESCLGPHGVGTRNINGSLLVDFAKSCKLRVAGSWYQRPDLHRWTWISNAGNAVKEIDHILVGTRWKLIQNCRVFRSAEFFCTDHRLVVATLRLCLKSKRQSGSRPVRLDLEKLQDKSIAREFAAAVSDRCGSLGAQEDPNQLWEAFKCGTLEAARACIPVRPKARSRFVTRETLDIIGRSRTARLDGKTGLHVQLRRQAKSAVKKDKERWVQGIAREVESNLFTGCSRPAFQALKRLRSKSGAQEIAVKAEDGRLLTDPGECRTRWAEYFERLLASGPPIRQLMSGGLTVLVADPPINVDPPSLEETRVAVGRLKGGKAAGICEIAGEMLKEGGPDAIRALHTVVAAVWQSGIIPTDWKRGLVVPIWKGKGDRQDCSNYRGVTLLSVPGKVLAQLLLSRVRGHLLLHQRPEQSGFTPKRSTIDRILALRVLVERRLEFRQSLFTAYVDLKKAFDSVHREALWEILRLRGVPAKIIELISGLYSGTESAVKCGGATSDFFPMNSGVRLGCVLAPTLFNTCMDWVLGRVADRGHCGVSFGEVKITDLDFADDAALLAESLDNLVAALEALNEETQPLGLQVSWAKTKVQVFGDVSDVGQSVRVCSENVEVLDRFTYLGSVIQSNGGSDLDVKRLGYGLRCDGVAQPECLALSLFEQKD